MNLLAASQGMDWSVFAQNVGYALIAALGVGAVIFIHELGHFAVAKWCGVKCEKFYIGFGKALVKFQWGETEYGIGMIPLGGYVKMLGQDDNPSAAAAEMDRARVDQGDATETVVYDPRSYMAKTVPQRMAIISAGVIMNLIFAFVVASVAYAIGVPDAPCRVGGTVPGGGAWKANLQPGDTIVSINGTEVKRFDDLRGIIALGSNDGGVRLNYLRPGEKEVREAIIEPNLRDLMPMIGVQPAYTKTLVEELPVLPGLAASEAKPAFQGGDEIVKIDDKPIKSALEIERLLSSDPSKPFHVTVRRKSKEDATKFEEVTTILDPAPLKSFGIRMKLGKITAVQEDSPAAKAPIPSATPGNADQPSMGALGLKPGDQITEIAGVPENELNPLELPEMIRKLAGQPVTIKIQRESTDKFEVEVIPRGDTIFEPADGGTEQGLSIPALGIVCEVVNNVRAVKPDSPAAKAGIEVNDKVEWIEFLPLPVAEGEVKPEFEGPLGAPVDRRIYLGSQLEQIDWPQFMRLVQGLRAEQQVRLKLENKEEPVVLTPAISSSDYYPERGLVFQGEKITIQADSLGEAMSMGGAETWKQATRVYRFLKQLMFQKVSPNAAGGPLSIGYGAFKLAGRGTSEFLMFLVAISANLAVINFLPIPVLDGGHMVFLALEGIRGKPASEKLFIGATYGGLAFLLLVMGFVMFLDVHRFFFA